jgi:hypothetical protein
VILKLVHRVQAHMAARCADERKHGKPVAAPHEKQAVVGVIVSREIPLSAVAVRAGAFRFRLPQSLAKLLAVQIDAPVADVRAWSRVRL